MLIFLLWYVKKKKKEKHISGKPHIRKDWSWLNCRHRWSESTGLRGDSNGCILEYLQMVIWGYLSFYCCLYGSSKCEDSLKRKWFGFGGSIIFKGAVEEGQEEQGDPWISPLCPLSISAWAAHSAGAQAPAISPEFTSSDGWKWLGHPKVGSEMRSEVKGKLVTSHFFLLSSPISSTPNSPVWLVAGSKEFHQSFRPGGNGWRSSCHISLSHCGMP